MPFAAAFALAVGASACVAARAAAQAAEGAGGGGVPGLAIAEWNTENGLPSNAVRDIRQTADGFLWLATYEGLVRFDGVAFRSFGEAEIRGLNRASFRRLAVDRGGALWAAGETGGVVRRANGRWRVFTTRDGLASDRVTAVLPAPDGSVWVGRARGSAASPATGWSASPCRRASRSRP